MTRIRFKSVCLALLLVLQPVIALGSSISPSDSIRRQLSQLSGSAKLQALNNLCYIAGNQNDSINELRCIKDYQKEAEKQRNVEDQIDARVMRLNCLYNYQMWDQMAEELPGNLDFFAKYERWDKYYGKWTLIVESCLNKGQFQTALKEIDKIYDDAKSRGNASGLGIAYSCLGKTYLHMRIYSQSAKNFEKALKYLKPGVNDTELLDTYDAYSRVLNNIYDYKRERALGPGWLKLLDSYLESYRKQGLDTSGLDDFYRKYYSAMSSAEAGLRHYPQAKQMLDKALALCENSSPLARVGTLASLSLYYKEVGEYDKALATNKERYELDKYLGNDYGILDIYDQNSEILMKAGRPAEAAVYYRKMLPLKDSLNSVETSHQLNELNTIYKVDQLKQEKRLTSYKLYAALLCCTLLAVILVIIVLNARARRKTNKVLYERIQDNRKEYESPMVSEFSLREGQQMSMDESVFINLNMLMREEELYKNPLLSRDDLADKVGTNRNILLDIIKKYTNSKSVTDFVNSYRLRNAAFLLVDKPGLPITAVGEASGFNSRSSFNRLFTERYGMTPSEFRKISNQEHKHQSK
jgi:AraC-like DNA-binding protein